MSSSIFNFCLNANQQKRKILLNINHTTKYQFDKLQLIFRFHQNHLIF